MVFRQVFLGVSGGAVLAILALFLTLPRALIEEEAPEWLRELLPEPRGGSAAAAEPSGHVGVDGTEPREVDLTSAGENLEEGHLVASLGPGVAVEPEEPDLEGNSRVDEVAEPSADELHADSYLGALSKQTIIRSRPHPDGTIIGFARTGALLRRAQVPAGHVGCKEGWYKVEPDGYVCVGRTATLDPEHPIIQLASYQPDRTLALPYAYGTSRYPTPPLYTRIPTAEQQRFAEQDLAHHTKKNFGAVWEDAADIPPPSLLENGELIPRPYGYPILEHDFMTGRALGSSSFAFIDMFESEGRRWGLTADLSLLPLDRLVPVQESEFSGVQLEDGNQLPVAFVRSRAQYLYEGSPEEGNLRPTRAIAYREAFHLTGREVALHGSRYFETDDGAYIKEHPLVVRIEAREAVPKWAKDDRSWIEVSILDQTLVAYRGDRPVFATLVSTGRDGLGDPEETFSTVRGVFLIHTKHVTATMSGDEADDEFDLRDVPYVQYFHGGYAFHAAFWHDGFGQPRSHGCINLSPRDARTLFSLTEPPVPLRWHSALSTEGTLVYIHP